MCDILIHSKISTVDSLYGVELRGNFPMQFIVHFCNKFLLILFMSRIKKQIKGIYLCALSHPFLFTSASLQFHLHYYLQAYQRQIASWRSLHSYRQDRVQKGHKDHLQDPQQMVFQLTGWLNTYSDQENHYLLKQPLTSSSFEATLDTSKDDIQEQQLI